MTALVASSIASAVTPGPADLRPAKFASPTILPIFINSGSVLPIANVRVISEKYPLKLAPQSTTNISPFVSLRSVGVACGLAELGPADTIGENGTCGSQPARNNCKVSSVARSLSLRPVLTYGSVAVRASSAILAAFCMADISKSSLYMRSLETQSSAGTKSVTGEALIKKLNSNNLNCLGSTPFRLPNNLAVWMACWNTSLQWEGSSP